MPNLTDVLEAEDRVTVEGIVDDMNLGSGDMYKSVYDTGGTDGIVDNAEKVNNLTVETAVPATFDFANVAFTNVNNTYTVAQSGDKEVVAPVAGAVDLDFETSNRFQTTITENTTINLPTNISENQGGVIYVIQGVGGSTITWNAVFKPMNIDTSTGTVGDVQVYSYEVYSATKIILSHVGTI